MEMELDEANCTKVKSNIQVEVDRLLVEEEAKRKEEEEIKNDEDDEKPGKKKKKRKGPGGKKGKGGKANAAAKTAVKVQSDDDKFIEGLSVFVGRKKEGSDYSRDIVLDGINIAFGNIFLLDNAKLTLNWGIRYGLIGRNG